MQSAIYIVLYLLAAGCHLSRQRGISFSNKCILTYDLSIVAHVVFQCRCVKLGDDSLSNMEREKILKDRERTIVDYHVSSNGCV